MRTLLHAITLTALVLGTSAARADDADALASVSERFVDGSVEEQPSFQRHVVPLFGRLGCNGRSCHGSFQGRGGLRLSLFGYDFKADHEALFDKDSPRVIAEKPAESLIVAKPISDDEHEGGQRFEPGSWQHHLIRNWIAGGAKYDEFEKLKTLVVEPSELLFANNGQKTQLKAIAVWSNGVREDVTPLCRFRTNNSEIAEIDENGLVTSKKAGDTHVVVFYDNAVIPVAAIRPLSDKAGAKYPKIATRTEVDKYVVQKLRKLGVIPSDVCTDEEFLRRVRLDLTGTLPTPGEVQAFLADKSGQKRSRKIDELLETPEYAAWWATKFCDFTGNNETQLNNITPVRGRAGAEWYQWIYQRILDNQPYDKLTAGIVTATSRLPDESYRDYCERMSQIYKGDVEDFAKKSPTMPYYWGRRDLRQPPERAISFAYAFMGVRIQCAQCHKHPFDQWSKTDFEQFSKFFGGVVASNNGRDRKEYNALIEELGLKGERGGKLRGKLTERLKEGKIIPFSEIWVRKGKGEAKLLGDKSVDLAELDDPRTELMQWLRSPANQYFSRAFVNRVWASYFHVGIVEPADDLSLANPPSNQDLLDFLANGFVENKFDMKWVHRTILGSDTYQRSWRPNATNDADNRNFSRMIPRRLPAEVVYDALQQATMADNEVAQRNEELTERAICVPSSGRARGRNASAAYALGIFGRSTRESNCDCDRQASPSLLQTMYLQNDREVLGMVSNTRNGWLDQVVKTYGLSRNNAANANAARQLENLEKRLEVFREKGNKEQTRRIKKQIAALQKRIGKDKTSSTAEQREYNPGEIVQAAYLRTLSREPSQKELERSIAYLADSEDKVNGVRDLLWALINTKEFIVNH